MCGAGKSTMIRHLPGLLPEGKFAICEFDYPNVPTDTPESWRPERTETWLRAAVENARNHVSTIVCGLVHADEVLSAPSASIAPRVRFAFLEAEHRAIASRLNDRYATGPYAEYLWRQARVRPHEFIATMIPYQRALKALFVETKYETFFVDTTNEPPEHTASRLATWILS